MIWIYRIQQRLGMTTAEGSAFLVLALVIMSGLTWHHFNKSQVPEEIAAQEEQEILEEGATRMRADPHEASTVYLPPDSMAITPAVPSGLTPINLNTATAEELERLPRIGPKMAQRILTHRRYIGSYKQVEQLLEVKGIGEKTLSQLRSRVFIGPDEQDQRRGGEALRF